MEREYRVVVRVGDIFENTLLEKLMGSFDTEDEAEKFAHQNISNAERVFGFDKLDEIVNIVEYAEVAIISDEVVDTWDIPIYA